MSMIIEHRFSLDPRENEKAAEALILIYRALGILPATPESDKLASKFKYKNKENNQSKAG